MIADSRYVSSFFMSYEKIEGCLDRKKKSFDFSILIGKKNLSCKKGSHKQELKQDARDK
jgi:hypothetical protein